MMTLVSMIRVLTVVVLLMETALPVMGLVGHAMMRLLVLIFVMTVMLILALTILAAGTRGAKDPADPGARDRAAAGRGVAGP